MIKKILLVLGILLAIPLVTALFVKQDYEVETQVMIQQPAQVVFDYIRFLGNQDNFSVWAAMVQYLQKSYRGVDGSVGFVSGWQSDNPDVGCGDQVIKAI